MELTLQEKHKLINFFEFLLDKETSKPMGEMNSEAVDNYVKILLHLQDKRVELSPEFIDEQVRKIFHPEETAAPETAKTTKKQYNKNKIWLVAACVSILVALFSILSFSSEKSVVDTLEDFFGTFEFIPFGEEVTKDKISYGKESNSNRYTTIQELTQNEHLELLYPTNIKDTVNLISIGKTNKKNVIDISYINSNLFIYIELNSELPDGATKSCDKKTTINGTDFYIFTMNDVPKVQAYFIHNNNLYVITHSDEKSLMEILKNMEEIKYED